MAFRCNKSHKGITGRKREHCDRRNQAEIPPKMCGARSTNNIPRKSTQNLSEIKSLDGSSQIVLGKHQTELTGKLDIRGSEIHANFSELSRNFFPFGLRS